VSNSRLPKAPEHAIRTCADTLIHPGACCTDGCGVRATLAVLDQALVEHTRCAQHAGSDPSLTKPLLWDPTWEPPGRHDHAFRRVVDGEEQTAVLAVQPSGVVIASEAAMVALMADAGWERVS
jgi:hypothetical protein